MFCIIIFSWWTLTSWNKQFQIQMRYKNLWCFCDMILNWRDTSGFALALNFCNKPISRNLFDILCYCCRCCFEFVKWRWWTDFAETEIGIMGNWKKRLYVIYQNFLHSIFTFRYAAFERRNGIKAFLKPHSYAYNPAL